MSLFDGLSEAEKSTVSLFAQERLIKAGEILFREGDDATAMYIVKSGTLRAYLERSTGEQMLGYNNVGDMVGEMALFDE
ncbi:MAG: cyclic nucleotide-binding domain-containing protein [Patescibacteria group bacterium]